MKLRVEINRASKFLNNIKLRKDAKIQYNDIYKGIKIRAKVLKLIDIYYQLTKRLKSNAKKLETNQMRKNQ